MSLRKRTRRFASIGISYGFANSEARTLVAAMTTQPDAARKAVIDTCIGSLKSAGIWDKLDLLYVIAAHASQPSRLNWKAPGTFTLAAVGSPVFTADQGFAGDGASARLQTGWTPSTQGVNYIQNDASLWVWSRTNSQEAANGFGLVASPGCFLTLRDLSDRMFLRVNDGTSSQRTSVTDSSGLIGASRVDANTLRAWRNGVQVGADISVASTGVPSSGPWALSGATTQFTARQNAMAAWGASLAGLEASFYTTMLAYMQAVGAA